MEGVRTDMNKKVVGACLKMVGKVDRHSVAQVRSLMFALLERYTQALIIR